MGEQAFKEDCVHMQSWKVTGNEHDISIDSKRSLFGLIQESDFFLHTLSQLSTKSEAVFPQQYNNFHLAFQLLNFLLVLVYKLSLGDRQGTCCPKEKRSQCCLCENGLASVSRDIQLVIQLLI